MRTESSRTRIWHMENFNFFSELSSEQRKFLCENTLMKTAPPNTTIYFQGDPAHSIYFLIDGKIKIARFNQEGEEFLVMILGPGEIFGESSIINDSTRKEAAIVEQEAKYCEIKEEKFQRLLFMVPSLNIKFSQFLEERLEKAQKRLQDIKCKSNEQRILDFILEMALLSEKNQEGQVTINHSFTQQEIAQLTSTNRQEVSSVFCHLKKSRIIAYDRKTIRVLNPKGLLS